MHAIFVSFLPVQSRSYFTHTTPDRDKKIEELFDFLLFKPEDLETSYELHSEVLYMNNEMLITIGLVKSDVENRLENRDTFLSRKKIPGSSWNLNSGPSDF